MRCAMGARSKWTTWNYLKTLIVPCMLAKVNLPVLWPLPKVNLPVFWFLWRSAQFSEWSTGGLFR